MKYSFYNSCKSDFIKRAQDENIPSMLEYFTEFDPITWKYSIDKERELPADAYAEASIFEEMQQFGFITKKEYSYMMENLKLVYGKDNPEVKDDIRAYHLAEDKIIYRFLAIPLLNKMFDEDYFNFEWDMHVGQNFSEHRNQYYRDHFTHQIRNLYMMLIMLDRFQLYKACSAIFHDRNAGKVSEYVYKKWRAFQADEQTPQMNVLKKIHKDSYTEKKYFEDFFFNYVIYASTMLCALFHDMGYPICHFLEVRHRISDYNPTMYMFTHNSVDSFDLLASRLGASLLFTVVSTHELKRRLSIKKSGNFDHGAYSAIAFLLQFYDNGMIFTLPPEKQCAIELAALAIYNHTATFNVTGSKSDSNYYSMVFRQNPIAFLLRFCDDLQEWDRRYFEISEASDLMFCKKCRTPILKRRGKIQNESDYLCACGSNKTNSSIVRPDVFAKRKLYLVTVADWVSMAENQDKKILNVKIGYDLYKLLMLSHINNTYAKHRLKELGQLKKLVSDQNFEFLSGVNLGFSHINLDYFMSANPILIKLKILEQYVRWRWNLKEGKIEQTNQVIFKKLEDLKNSEEDKVLFIIRILGNRITAKHPLVKYLLGVDTGLNFYIELFQCCLWLEGDTENDHQVRYKKLCSKYIDSTKVKNVLYQDAMRSLIDDCIRQYKREYLSKSSKDPQQAREAYYGRYVTKEYEDTLYHYIAVYTDSGNSFNDYAKDARPPYISYFNDIQLFYKMNLRLQAESTMGGVLDASQKKA